MQKNNQTKGANNLNRGKYEEEEERKNRDRRRLENSVEIDLPENQRRSELGQAEVRGFMKKKWGYYAPMEKPYWDW